jgi:hypothetical protein
MLKRHRGIKERALPAIADRVRSGCLLFGRDREMADVYLDSTRFPNLISRIHAAIYYEAPASHSSTDQYHGWVIEDRSLNGVFVNDERANKTIRLRDGDLITFGSPPPAAIVRNTSTTTTATASAASIPRISFRFYNSLNAPTAASPTDVRAASQAVNDAAIRQAVEQEIAERYAREKQQSDAEKESLLKELRAQLEQEQQRRQKTEQEQEQMRSRIREIQEESEKQRLDELEEYKRKQAEAEKALQGTHTTYMHTGVLASCIAFSDGRLCVDRIDRTQTSIGCRGDSKTARPMRQVEVRG